MACVPSTLITSACESGLAQAAGNEIQFRALILQLLYIKSGTSDSLATLLDSACDNGFEQLAQNEQQFRAVELQLLCQLTGG